MATKILPCLLLSLPFLAAGQPNSPQFDSLWTQNKAEINIYDLQQARYGFLHPGQAVLIFVAEDFSRSKQIKLDNPQRNPSDAVRVLKSHLNKKFTTGIYDYSLTLSTFTPSNRNKYPHTIKSTATTQDWNGHSFTQINLQTYKYRIQQFSYSEADADQETITDKVILEDELFNLIRINPDLLPLGSISIMPSSLTARLLHQPIRPVEAEASLQDHPAQPLLETYTLEYKDLNRTLKIHYLRDFPHTIEGWEESYPENGKILTTQATRRQSTFSDFWNQNSPDHTPLRKNLGF